MNSKIKDDMESEIIAEKITSDGVAWYDFEEVSCKVAEKNGLIVVMPNPDQIQIDIDSEEQMDKFYRRLASFMNTKFKPRFEIGSGIVSVAESKSGHPKYHITITFPGHEFTELERILYQAALNDDPLRVFLNLRRYHIGVENPSRLFEKPPSDIASATIQNKQKEKLVDDDIF